jgi:DNA repair photolyase
MYSIGMAQYLKGRGALSNPANRFAATQVAAVDDGWSVQEVPDSIATHVRPERARTIITTNQSPDIPYEQSINPYRGCEHGCPYCAAGDTLILMADGRTRALADLRIGDEIYGTRGEGGYRRYTKSRVLAHWSAIKPAFRTTLQDGTTLVTSGDHRLLTEEGWKYVKDGPGDPRPHLTSSNKLMGVGASAVGAPESDNYRRRYRDGTVRPAFSRELDLEGQAVKSGARLRVIGIEPLQTMRLYDITTESEDFIANGVVSHNCYARPSHAYMDLSPGLDFETHLFYKADAAQLLRAELSKPSYVCKPITVGANTDPYQPLEKRLKVTRSILEVLRDTRHPVTIITKGALIARDLDLLADLARDGLVNVFVTVTTLDNETKRLLEPRAAAPAARLKIIRQLTDCGVNVGVLVAPIIPVITEHEVEQVLAAAAAAGARRAGYVMLRLPHELKILFREWLQTHYPERAAHVMSIVRSMRGGQDNDPRFGSRMRGTGPFAQLLRQRFQLACVRNGLARGVAPPLPTALFRRPPANSGQMELGL